MLNMLLTSWFSPSPEPSPHPEFHVGASKEDMEFVASSGASLRRGRLCHRGHRVEGVNAYRRSNGRLECRQCRAAASKRYRLSQKARLQ